MYPLNLPIRMLKPKEKVSNKKKLEYISLFPRYTVSITETLRLYSALITTKGTGEKEKMIGGRVVNFQIYALIRYLQSPG